MAEWYCSLEKAKRIVGAHNAGATLEQLALRFHEATGQLVKLLEHMQSIGWKIRPIDKGRAYGGYKVKLVKTGPRKPPNSEKTFCAEDRRTADLKQANAGFLEDLRAAGHKPGAGELNIRPTCSHIVVRAPADASLCGSQASWCVDG